MLSIICQGLEGGGRGSKRGGGREGQRREEGRD